MAMVSKFSTFRKSQVSQVFCRKSERDRVQNHPFKVIEITPPPRNLGVRCFPPVIRIHVAEWLVRKTINLLPSRTEKALKLCYVKKYITSSEEVSFSKLGSARD